MNKRLLVVTFAFLAVAAVALGAYLALDGGGAPTPRPGPETTRAARPAAPDPGFAPGGAPAGAPATGAPTPVGSGVTLSPAEEAAVRAALDRVGSESAVREQLMAGVERPWKAPAARQAFRWCLERARDMQLPSDEASVERICACATRAVQRIFPADPPVPTTRDGRKGYERAVKDAIDACNTQ